jgi:SelR domain
MHRRHLLALSAVSLLALLPRGRRGVAETFEISKTEAEWKAALTPEQYAVMREEATERPWTSALLDEHRKGVFACAATLRCRDQVRQWHRLAKLLRCLAQRGRQKGGQHAVHDAHRGTLPPLRRASGACLGGWTATNGTALLHEWRGLAVPCQRGSIVT